MKREKPERSFWNCCAKKPVMITQVKVIKAEGLEKQERDGRLTVKLRVPFICIVGADNSRKVRIIVRNKACPVSARNILILRVGH